MEGNLWPSGEQEGLVATVDPSDLKRVWTICHNVKGQVAIGFAGLELACRSGSDVRSTWYRAALLEMLCGRPGLLSPWLNNDELNDAVFRVAATFHIRKLQVGMPNQKPPLDVQAFLKQVETESNL